MIGERERNGMQTELLASIKERQTFSWGESRDWTIEDVIQQRAWKEATDKLSVINARIALNSRTVVDKVKPRAATWQITDLLEPYMVLGDAPLEKLMELLGIKKEEAKMDNDLWVVETLGYEARAASRRKAAAHDEKDRISTESVSFKIGRFKKEPDEKYGDTFNRLVCEMADKMDAEGVVVEDGKNKMAEAERIIKKQIAGDLSDKDIEAYLADRIKQQLEARLQNLCRSGFAKLQDKEKAETYAALMFEIDSRKTNDVWQGKTKKLEDVIARGLKGETVNLVTMFCTINNYDFNGHYTLVPDIFAYQKINDQQLEPVPLIINELAQVARFFQFYGINAPMTIYVSDADYIESKQCGPVTENNLQNLQLYLQNLKDYLVSQNFPMSVMFISEVTQNNAAYKESKARIWENVSTMKNPKFLKEWRKAFEEDLLKRVESQRKRKLFPESDIETETLEIVKRIWSVNGAQGTFLGTLPENTLLISTERRERDQNYVIDGETRDQFVPVLYILQAADNWTRKIVQGSNDQDD